jgi:hypothetical protein
MFGRQLRIPGQRGDTSVARRPARFAAGNAPANSQNMMRYCQFMRRRADIHARIVEHEILDMDKLASDPHAGCGVEEMPTLDKAVANRTASHDFIEAGNLVLCRFRFPISIAEKSCGV